MDELIAAVEEIDPTAAEYLRGDAKLVKSYCEVGYVTTVGNKLLTVMNWDETPQGHHYWSNIYHQLLAAEMWKRSNEQN